MTNLKASKSRRIKDFFKARATFFLCGALCSEKHVTDDSCPKWGTLGVGSQKESCPGISCSFLGFLGSLVMKRKMKRRRKKGLENEKTVMNGFWVAFCFHQHTALFTTTNRAPHMQELEK